MNVFTVSFLLVSAVVHLGHSQNSDELQQLVKSYQEKIATKHANKAFNPKVAKNVVLVLVEGLDTHTMAVARKMVADTTRPTNNYMDTLDGYMTGFLKTPSRDFLVSDPAATVSAMFNGLPEYNGQMGWVEQGDSNCTEFDPSKKLLKNLFKVMADAGKHTALVTTSSLTSPGVAGMFASSPDMQLEYDLDLKDSGCSGGTFMDIAEQLIHYNDFLNVIIGAGRRKFLSKNTVDPLTNEKLSSARSDMDLRSYWAMEKAVKKKPNKVPTGYKNITAALKESMGLKFDYILGFLGDKEEGFTETDLGQLVIGARHSLQNNNDGQGYFLAVYSDEMSRQHKESRVVQVVDTLNTILRFLYAIGTLPSIRDDTLVILASTQGSTLTLASGSRLDEPVISRGRTEDCKLHTYMNYAFGPQQNAQYTDETAQSNFQYQSLYKSDSIFGGSDLPVFAFGPGSHVFNGVNDHAYVYHALLYATCLSPEAQSLYHQCATETTSAPPTTTTTTTTTTATTPTTIPTTPVVQTTTTTPPVRPTPFPTPWPPLRPTARPFNWPWVQQVQPQSFGNPYNSLGPGFMNSYTEQYAEPPYNPSSRDIRYHNQNQDPWSNAAPWLSLLAFS